MHTPSSQPENAVNILLVNPPTPDRAVWIRNQDRAGRRSREGMLWPQVDLAQLAAMIYPPYSFRIIDANAERMSWSAFERQLQLSRPRYYVTQLATPSLENDQHGVSLAKAQGAWTVAFGTHVSTLPTETLRSYPALDFVLVGEPELTLRDLVDTLEGRTRERAELVVELFAGDSPASPRVLPLDLGGIPGLGWRKGEEVVVNPPRGLIRDLDRLPLPLHEALPWKKYVMPLLPGPFTFVTTSRGCPAGCTFCVKHTVYGNTVRIRSPEKIIEELRKVATLGIRNIHFYADLFTVDRVQVVDLCQRMIVEKLDFRWTANSRVDFVDEELLALMKRAGCWLIDWGLENASEAVLRAVHKGINRAEVEQALAWSHRAGIQNWGYFIIGLPGETEETIRETIVFSKRLPLEIALFFLAAPYPGTPLYHQAIREGWLPAGGWEQVDMDGKTRLAYPHLSTARMQYWQRRAFLEWALRPAPLGTFLKMLLAHPRTLRTAWGAGLEALRWS